VRPTRDVPVLAVPNAPNRRGAVLEEDLDHDARDGWRILDGVAMAPNFLNDRGANRLGSSNLRERSRHRLQHGVR